MLKCAFHFFRGRQKRFDALNFNDLNKDSNTFILSSSDSFRNSPLSRNVIYDIFSQPYYKFQTYLLGSEVGLKKTQMVGG